jgi:hypothetical protein
MSSPHELTPHDNSEIEPGLFLPLPDGNFVNVLDLIKRERKSGEQSLIISDLETGDLVAFTYDNEGAPAGFTFEVTDAESSSRIFTFEPKEAPDEVQEFDVKAGHEPVQVVGVLKGERLPPKVQDVSVSAGGSGWGGSMIMPKVIATGRMPYFFRKGYGEYRAPVVDGIQVLRRDDNGEFQVVPGIVAETGEATT